VEAEAPKENAGADEGVGALGASVAVFFACGSDAEAETFTASLDPNEKPVDEDGLNNSSAAGFDSATISLGLASTFCEGIANENFGGEEGALGCEAFSAPSVDVAEKESAGASAVLGGTKEKFGKPSFEEGSGNLGSWKENPEVLDDSDALPKTNPVEGGTDGF
jgi:hypothetical protein